MKNSTILVTVLVVAVAIVATVTIQQVAVSQSAIPQPPALSGQYSSPGPGMMGPSGGGGTMMEETPSTGPVGDEYSMMEPGVDGGMMMGSAPMMGGSPMMSPQTAADEQELETGEVQTVKPVTNRIVLVAQEWGFNQSKGAPTIILEKGAPVHVTLINEGQTVHDFVVPQLELHGPHANPGESKGFSLTVNDVGAFTYICSIPGHKELGMQGKIIVEQ